MGFNGEMHFVVGRGLAHAVAKNSGVRMRGVEQAKPYRHAPTKINDYAIFTREMIWKRSKP